MRGARLYLILQTVLCVLLTALLAAGTVSLYWKGAVRQEERPLESIYTRDKAAEELVPIVPIFLLFLMLTAAGLIFSPALRSVRGEESAGPVDIDCTLLASCSSAVMKVRRVLILAAALLITAGVINGSARDVFYKAVRICTECIGLG